MILKRIRGFGILFCLLAYLPVLLGGGECVALCVESDGSIALDFSHRCGSVNTAETSSADIEYFYISGPRHIGSCRDIPISSGKSFISITNSSVNRYSKHVSPVKSFFHVENPTLSFRGPQAILPVIHHRNPQLYHSPASLLVPLII